MLPFAPYPNYLQYAQLQNKTIADVLTQLAKIGAGYVDQRAQNKYASELFPQQTQATGPAIPLPNLQSGGPPTTPAFMPPPVQNVQQFDPMLALQYMSSGDPNKQASAQRAINAQLMLRQMQPNPVQVSPGAAIGTFENGQFTPQFIAPKVATQHNLTEQDLGLTPRKMGGFWQVQVQDKDPVTGQLVGAPRWKNKTPVSAYEAASEQPDPLPELSGPALLAKLPPGDKALVQSVGEGRTGITGIANFRTRERISKLVTRAYPTYDANYFTAMTSLSRDAVSRNIARNARSMNMAIGHMAELAKASDDLKNSDWQTYNSISNFIRNNTGDPRVVAFNTAANAVGTELAATFKGGSSGAAPTEQEIGEWQKNLNTAQSPQQIDAVLNMGVKLLGSRLQSLNYQVSQWKSRPANFDLISPAAKTILDNFGFDWNKYNGENPPPADTPPSGNRPPLESFVR